MAARPLAPITALVIGFAIGLVLGWGVWPVQDMNAAPADLRSDYRDDYIRMIGAAFSLDSDLAGAKERLARLGLSGPVQTINGLIVRERQINSDALTREALVRLAGAISGPASAQEDEPTPVSVSAIPTRLVPAFRLVERTQLSCADEPKAAYLRFTVLDSRGRDFPNVGIQVTWPGGDEVIYTGLKPERGQGYADLEVAPATYNVTILNSSSDPIPELTIGEPVANCQASSSSIPRGWRLVLQQR